MQTQLLTTGATGLPRLAETVDVKGARRIWQSEYTADEHESTWNGYRSPGHAGDGSRHQRFQDGSAPNPAEHMDLPLAATA